jgi:hypothetical protein
MDPSFLANLALSAHGSALLDLKTEYQPYRWSWTQSKHNLELKSCGILCSTSALPPEAGSAYSYTRLREPREIRLLKLFPAPPAEPLQGDLLQYPLEDAPPYQAVSYTWGDPKAIRLIWINGNRLGLTENAHGALHRLRSLTNEQLFWIDSICIDQSSLDEKNQQINLMADIYRTASGVTAWLGNGRHASLARFFIRDLWLRLRDSHHVVINPNEAKWNALISFLKHTWFNRVCVIQEVVMSSSLSIVYGAGSIPFGMVAEVAHALCSSTPYFTPRRALNVDLRYIKRMKRTFPSELRQIVFMRNTRRRKGITNELGSEGETDPDLAWMGVKDDYMPPLCEVLRFCAGAGSTEAKDKIFALMKLSNEYSLSKRPFRTFSTLPVSPAVFSIDYKMTTELIYTKCALNLLIRERSLRRTPLNVLPQAGVGYQRHYPSLPSWVPDWSALPQSWLLAFERGDQYNYRAAGVTSDHRHFNSPLPSTDDQDDLSETLASLIGLPKLSERQYVFPDSIPGRIVLEGVCVDEIVAISDPFDPVFNERDLLSSLRRIVTWLNTTRFMAHASGLFNKGAYWRTLIGDKTYDELWPAPKALSQTLPTNFRASCGRI